MKTHSCFRLLANALTGAILFTTTALQAEAADQVKVTDLMTKDLVNVPGKEVWRDPSDWTGLNCSSASFGWFFLLGFLVALSIESGQQTGVQTYP